MRGQWRGIAVAVSPLVLLSPLWAQTQQKLQDVAEPKAGIFSQVVPIEVPAFHGVEPHVALSYSSSVKNGFPGVGWGLAGIGTIRATKNGRGVPAYTPSDVYLLGGVQLVPCAQATQSPSCTAGGTHARKEESYLRVKRVVDSHGTVTWSVWAKDGTRTDYSPVYSVPEGTLRWGQTATTDTHGNHANYTWACDDGDCYPSAITFGPYAVSLYREARSDIWTFATGSSTVLGRTSRRLRSVLVTYNGTPIRAYQLTYETSPGTLRSRLIAVRQFGTDVVIDGSGQITGGTSAPQRTFTYWDDPARGTLHSW
jgi:hypothetical protein